MMAAAGCGYITQTGSSVRTEPVGRAPDLHREPLVEHPAVVARLAGELRPSLVDTRRAFARGPHSSGAGQLRLIEYLRLVGNRVALEVLLETVSPSNLDERPGCREAVTIAGCQINDGLCRRKRPDSGWINF